MVEVIRTGGISVAVIPPNPGLLRGLGMGPPSRMKKIDKMLPKRSPKITKP